MLSGRSDCCDGEENFWRFTRYAMLSAETDESARVLAFSVVSYDYHTIEMLLNDVVGQGDMSRCRGALSFVEKTLRQSPPLHSAYEKYMALPF